MVVICRIRFLLMFGLGGISTNSSAQVAEDVQFIFEQHDMIFTKHYKHPPEVHISKDLQTSEIKFILTGTIIIYQEFISTQDLPTCNFVPSCSEFCKNAIKESGLIYGLLLTSDRLQRCHGLEEHRYNIDPQTKRYYDPISHYVENSKIRIRQ